MTGLMKEADSRPCPVFLIDEIGGREKGIFFFLLLSPVEPRVPPLPSGEDCAGG